MYLRPDGKGGTSALDGSATASPTSVAAPASTPLRAPRRLARAVIIARCDGNDDD